MIRNFRFTVLAVAALAAVSCARENEDAVPGDACGTLDLASVVVSTEESETPTRAVATGNFILRVYDSGGTLVDEWDPYSSRPADYPLKVGMYTLEICSPTLPAADWETPWYVATEGFEITKDAVTTIPPLVCKLGNIKVTVRYSDGMQEYLTDAEVTVTIGSGKLVFGRDEAQAGYFRTTGAESEMKVSLKATIDGYNDTYTGTVTGLRAGQWHMVRFTYAETAGQRTFYIHVGEFTIGQITPGGDWGVIN